MRKKEDAAFPNVIYVKDALTEGEVETQEDSFLMAFRSAEEVETSERVAVYKLSHFVSISKKTVIKESRTK